MPQVSVTVFNASGDEPGGSDLIVNIVGAQVRADQSAVSAQQESNNVEVVIDGASVSVGAGVVNQWPANGWAWTALYQIGDSIAVFNSPENTRQIAESDLVVIQGFNPVLASEVEANTIRYQTMLAHNPTCKIYYYHDPGEIHQDGINFGQLSQFRWKAEMLASATRGSDDWYLKDITGSRVEHHFSPSHIRINECDHFMDGVTLPVNSFGRTYAQQSFLEIHEAWEISYNGVKLNDLVAGLYHDVHQSYPQSVYKLDVTPREFVLPDYNLDGTADGKGVGAGGDMWRTGSARWPAEFYARWGEQYSYWGNNAEDGIRSRSGELQVYPMSNNPLYGTEDCGFVENVNFGIKRNFTTANYPVAFNGFRDAFWDLALTKTRVVKSGHRFGDGFGPHMNILEYRLLPNDPFTDIDLEMYRTVGCMAALAGAMCGARRALNWQRLDEYNYDWGAPIDPTHPVDAMGVLDETDGSFSLRAPDIDQDVNEKAYYILFENVMWILRRDYPSSVFGDGQAVTFLLPSAGSGKVWRHPDFTTTYTNPKAPWLQTRNQSPSVNNGALAGNTGSQIALKPMHARMLVRSDV